MNEPTLGETLDQLDLDLTEAGFELTGEMNHHLSRGDTEEVFDLHSQLMFVGTIHTLVRAAINVLIEMNEAADRRKEIHDQEEEEE